MEKISFIIDGNPYPQKRHRHVNRGKFTSVYDPSKATKHAFLMDCMEYAPAYPFENAVSVEVKFGFKRPKSHWGTGKNGNKLKPSAPVEHTQKSDIDNLQKHFMDALNGVFWKDDSLINKITATKCWSSHDGYTSVKIESEEGE